ncbi:MAG TPA: sulfatase-like hydrolase/transferase, partial [Planctomycetota bacterium]|nr:sulfatase-like hydrolase/transferase [Planctomycetota bacterium]
ELAKATAQKARQAYWSAISFADAQIGKVLDALDETGLAESTIVIFTSDHGYHMGEHGHWQKMTLFENAARVPLIVAGPGVAAAGKRTRSIVELVDLYPTIAELCGAPRPAHLSGKSLVPLLRDPSASVRESALTKCNNGYSLRTDRYRYTEWGPDGRGGRELYDHESDPVELVNLAERPEHRELAEKLAADLRARVAEASEPPSGVEQIRRENRRPIR